MDAIQRKRVGVFFSAVIVAIGGIIYELIIGTAASYLIGNSILHFSITIGVFLFGMGIGSFLSSFLKKSAENRFISVEILLSIIGGNSVFILFTTYAFTELFYPVLIAILIIMGTLIGLEIPLMIQILKNSSKTELINLVSRILSLDYIGALFASILFPVILLPYLGLLRTSYFVGLLNIIIALILSITFREKRDNRVRNGLILITILILGTGFIYSNKIAFKLDHKLYQDEIVFSKQTQYQKIVITKYKDDTRLYLNGNIQFSSRDEYRYHEPLVHIPAALAHSNENVLILGGGDGLAARELLKYADIKQITVVDLDKEMVELAKTYPALVNLNKNSLNNPKVEIINQDAFKFLEESSKSYDLIIIDLPDPNDESLAKLYSKEFYTLVRLNLSTSGAFATQATSIYFTNSTYWTIEKTISDADFNTHPYSSYIPSFGKWGFIAGTNKTTPTKKELNLSVETKYLTPNKAKEIFTIDNDLSISPQRYEELKINTIYNPSVIHQYNKDWSEWKI